MRSAIRRGNLKQSLSEWHWAGGRKIRPRIWSEVIDI